MTFCSLNMFILDILLFIASSEPIQNSQDCLLYIVNLSKLTSQLGGRRWGGGVMDLRPLIKVKQYRDNFRSLIKSLQFPGFYLNTRRKPESKENSSNRSTVKPFFNYRTNKNLPYLKCTKDSTMSVFIQKKSKPKWKSCFRNKVNTLIL